MSWWDEGKEKGDELSTFYLFLSSLRKGESERGISRMREYAIWLMWQKIPPFSLSKWWCKVPHISWFYILHDFVKKSLEYIKIHKEIHSSVKKSLVLLFGRKKQQRNSWKTCYVAHKSAYKCIIEMQSQMQLEKLSQHGQKIVIQSIHKNSRCKLD